MWQHTLVWGMLCALGCVGVAGCRTLPAQRLAQRTDAAGEARHLPGDAALEKRAEAHAHYAAGFIHEVQEQPEAALKEYYAAALSDPENETLVLELSRRFLQNKEPQKALEILSRAAERPNASGAVFARLGFVYSQLGKFDQAISASRTAIKKAPGSIVGYQNLFLNYLQNKQPQEAFKVLDEAAKQPRVDAEFLINLAELYGHLGLQIPSQRKAANTKGLAVLSRVEKLPALNAATRLKVAEDYNLLGDSARAAELFKELLHKVPDLPGLRERVRARLADIYLRGSDPEHAIEQLEAIIAEDPTNAQAYHSLAKLALEGKQLEKAVDYLGRAIVLTPDFLPAYYDLARAQLALKKTSDALATLEKARAKFPQDFALEYLTGIAFAQQKAYAEAIRHYTAAEVIAQATEPKWLDENFYFQLGAACERKGDYTEAQKNFEQCIKLAPQFSEALNYLGYMWAERGEHLDKARELIEKALQQEPKNPAYLDSLAWVLFKLNQPKEALPYLLQAVELSEEPDATLLDHLGDIYAALNESEQARKAWERSLTVESNEQVRKKLNP